MSATQFDRAYYARHYEDEATRVTDAEAATRLVSFVSAYLQYLQIPVDTVLDLGCGVGLWRDALAALRPKAIYRGVEHAEHACERYGWERGSVVDYDGEPADLVVCQGVLHYLGAADAERAIETLARVTEGALYLEALTVADWQDTVDQSLTDKPRPLRTGDWYARRLRPHFRALGGGLFVPREADIALFEFEAPELMGG